MSLILNECIEFKEKRKICIATENGKKYQLNNVTGNTIRKVKVDKCLPQNAGEKRCDFLIDIEELTRVFFIELKGSHLNKAVNQIYSTITYLKPEFVNYRVDARIVGSKDVPGFKNTPDYKKLANHVLPSGGTIERGTNNIYIENI
jgi:hypothetical protein